MTLVKLVLSFFTLMLFTVVLHDPLKLGIQDWDLNYAYALASNLSLLNYRQLPLWNPYHCGGMTQIGNAVNLFWTPFYLPVLFFGPVLGFKVQLLIFVVFGFLSTLSLGKYSKISKSGSVLISLIYVLSGTFFAPYATGMPVFLPLMLLPSVFLYLHKSLTTPDSLKSAVVSGLMVSLIFLSGFHYILHLVIFVFIVTSVFAFTSKSLGKFRFFFVIVIVFGATSAFRLLPVLETVLANPRYIREEFSGFSILSLLKSLIWPFGDFNSFSNWGVAGRNFIRGFSYNLDENSLYVGVIPLVLFLFGIFIRGKKHIKLSIILLFIVWLAFGFNVIPSLYELISGLPLLNTMRIAQRFRFYLFIPLILFVGMGFDRLLNLVGNRHGIRLSGFVAVFIILFVGLDLLAFDRGLLKNAFNIPLPESGKTGIFKQQNGRNYYDENGFRNTLTNYTSFSDEYPRIIGGWGSVNCYEPQPVIKSSLSFDHPSYRGEYFLQNLNGTSVRKLWSPNKYVFGASLTKEDILVVNQNYDRGWKTRVNGKIGRVWNNAGLISVSLPQGFSQITLYYLPDSFVLGTAVSLISALLICKFLLQPKHQNSGRNG